MVHVAMLRTRVACPKKRAGDARLDGIAERALVVLKLLQRLLSTASNTASNTATAMGLPDTIETGRTAPFRSRGSSTSRRRRRSTQPSLRRLSEVRARAQRARNPPVCCVRGSVVVSCRGPSVQGSERGRSREPVYAESGGGVRE